MARAAGTGVRVIAGSRRGRRLVVPVGDGVRPTKDIVREAMFSALESRAMIADAAVVDLYAGSGALAIESLSRGAARAVLVERDPSALEAISRNLDQLDLRARARVVRSNVASFLAAPPPAEGPFDLAFADPPYETSDDTVAALIGSLVAPGWLAAGAVIAVERPARAQTRPPDGFQACWERTFGDTLVVFVDAFDPSS